MKEKREFKVGDRVRTTDYPVGCAVKGREDRMFSPKRHVSEGKITRIVPDEYVKKYDLLPYAFLGYTAYFLTDLELIPEKKKQTNLIEVDYQDLESGEVRILAIRNLLSIKAIAEKHGPAVLSKYLDFHNPWMIERKGKLRTNRNQELITIPCDMSESKFNNLISYMRDAGTCLARITRAERTRVKEEKKANKALKIIPAVVPEIKTVTI